MHVPANAVLAVTLLGLSSSYYRFASERYWHTVRWPLRLVLIPTLLAVLAGLGFQTWRRTGECIQISRVASIHKIINQARAKESEAEKDTSPDRLAKLDAARVRLAELGVKQRAAMEGLVAAEPKNFEAMAELGEALRLQSFEGLPGWERLTENALYWFHRAMALNPYDPRSRVGYGMCLDRLGRTKEAEPYFEAAVRLDPNHFSIAARVGWHYFQVQDFVTAKRWFERSVFLLHDPRANTNAWTYLRLAEQKLAESTNSAPTKP